MQRNLFEYEDVLFDLESLFTSIPVEETINYIVDGIYDRKEVEPLCKKSLFKKLLFKCLRVCIYSC